MGKSSDTKYSDKFPKARLALIGFYIAIAVVNVLIYFEVIAVTPSMNNMNTIRRTLCWDNTEGTCLEQVDLGPSFRYFNIPMALTFESTNPIQNRQVTLSSQGGTISNELTEGLNSIKITYTSGVPYFDSSSQGYTVGGTGLFLQPTNSNNGFIILNDARSIESKQYQMMWQSEGDYYPVVNLNYVNGSSITHRFEEFTIHVQSQLDYETTVAGQILNAKMLAIGVIGAVGVVAEAAYRQLMKKDGD